MPSAGAASAIFLVGLPLEMERKKQIVLFRRRPRPNHYCWPIPAARELADQLLWHPNVLGKRSKIEALRDPQFLVGS